MAVVDRLLAAARPIWDRYNEHPFVKGIEDGTLDKEKFRYYILQDYLYLEEYAKVFAIGVAKAEDLEMIRLFAGYINVLTDGEMDIHRGYMGELGITQEELDAMPRALDNLSYTSYMLRVAYEETQVEILAGILSCAHSYEMIAKRIIENNPDSVNHPFYGDWIKGYASDAYTKENVALMAHLDRLTEHYTEQQVQHLIDIFVACSRYEELFWDMSWEMKK
ncbi:MAG: thiaminase II [Selenomonadales bacterium]|jgi:thiaminase/transcriptional activator TenA|nr:thiaminase II [Selenomonadales bacterium]MBQ2114581.1 thiaminase II [Selenomonadales bacterium]MBQ2245576.1 thiaminase II [Selenomonadales bacterium]MBQ5588257.1 thiaminase II [Selenomonadales bacterium]MBQ5636107.1 thiaminase II [Selenomonadales bacterium]